MTEILLFSLAALGTATFLWGCNKGFDITDEAIFLMQARHPEDVRCYPFFDFAYCAPLHRLTAGNIVVHRVILMALTVLSCAVFSYGTSHLITASFPALAPHHIELALVSYVGSLLRFVFGPRLLYYNHLNSFSLLIQAGILFSVFFGSSSHMEFKLLAVGALIGFQFFIKISSCLSSLATLLIMCPLLATGTVIERLYVDLLLLAGFLCFGVFHFTIVQSPRAWWIAFSSQLELAKLFTWGVSCVPRHFKEMRIFAAKGLRQYQRSFLVASGGAAVAMCCCSSSTTLIPCAGAIALWAMIEFVEQSVKLKTWEPTVYNERFSSVTSLVALMLLVGILSLPLLVIPNISDLHAADPRLWLALSLLAVLPFLGAIGTSNPLFVNTVFHHSTWYLLIGMMMMGWGKALGSDLLGELLLIILAAHGVKQTVYAMINQPYRLVGPLTAQTERIEIGFPATALKMSSAAANFIGHFKHMLEANGFKPGDDIIALFDMPGLVYAVGGRSPGHQWYYTVVDRNDAMMEANAWNLRRVATERLQRSFIIQKGDISFFHKHLNSLHISFPHEYALCGQLVSPFSHEIVTLWKPLIAVTQDDACSRYRHILLANRALEAGRPQAALQHMEAAVAEQPDNLELRVDTGNLLLNQGQPARAREHFEAALSISSTDAAASLGLAAALIQTETFSGVRPLIDTVLAADSQNVLALKILGCVARREGLATEAQKHFEKALIVQPNDQESLEQLIILETEHGNTPTAQELFERLSGLNPQNANLPTLRNALISRCETTAT